MAIPVATPTFQDASSARTEFRALDSRFRHRASCYVADSDRDRVLGSAPTRGVVKLDSPPGVGRRDRNVPVDGLRLLVVALGHAYGPSFLAIS